MDGALHHMTELSKIFEILKRKIDKGTIFIAREPQNSNKLFQFARKLRMKKIKAIHPIKFFFQNHNLTTFLISRNEKTLSFVIVVL